MKRLTTLLMTLMLMSMALWAEERITVSANSSDISEGLDLKVVAKLFAEAKNLEEFESMLNNPDSAFCNLDLNGDGQVDYLRVVETGEGNKRLIVLQAILAKDIYQDVASIYVEKDEKDQVSVQVVGDEYVYGTNYIIEPVYVYRPLIYDWFWSSAWYAWHSPWYWGYWPGWWHAHSCWAHDWYWRHCYAFHHHHHWCSFRTGTSVRSGYHSLHSGVTRRDFATAHPDRSFHQRNSGMTNAREIHRGSSSGVRDRQSSAFAGRTFDSRHTAATRSAATARPASATTSRSASATTTRPASATTTRSASTGRTADATTSRSGATGRTASTTTGRTSSATSATTTRPTSITTRSASAYTRSVDDGARSRSVSQTSSRPATSTYSGSSTRSTGSHSGSSYAGSTSRSSSYSGSSSRSSSRSSGSSSFSGGGSRSSSGGGGSHSSRR